jgi:HK97 family phage portal protein
MSAEAVENLRTQIDERHGGAAKSHRPMLLHSGLKIQSLQLPLEELQLLATRQFSIEEICRAFGVPPFMVGHNEKTTSWGSGVEAMGTAFVRYTLAGHLTKIHNEFNRKLFRTYTRVVEFDTFELERADMKSLMEAFRTAIGRAGEPGFMSVNEVRSFLNLGPSEGGDELSKAILPGANNAQAQPAKPPGE